MNMKKSLKTFGISLFTSVVLVGCGGGGGGSAAFVSGDSTVVNPTSILVERGAVIGATVVDSSTPAQEGWSTSNDNTYAFANPVNYPIIVTGGFIDVDGDGVYSEGDTNLGNLQMKSYSDVVTPVTTYIANQLGDNVSDEEREELLNQKYEELAQLLGDDVSIDDLKKAPSKMETRGSIIAVNAIYKELLEDEDDILDETMLRDEFIALKETLKEFDENDLQNGESLAQLLEKETISEIVKQEPALIEVADSDDVKAYENTYVLFNYLWKERKFVNDTSTVFANGNSYIVNNGQIQLTAVEENTKLSKSEIVTNLSNKGVNAINGTINLIDVGTNSFGAFKTVIDVSLSDELKTKYGTQIDINSTKMVAQIEFSSNKIDTKVYLTDNISEVVLDSLNIQSNGQNEEKTFSSSIQYLNNTFSLSVDGIDTFTFTPEEGLYVGEFESAHFISEVNDEDSTNPADSNAIVNITSFDATVKSLSAVNQAIQIILNTNLETDSIDTKLTEAKAKVENLSSNDAIMLNSMLELSEILNKEEVTNLVDIPTGTKEITNFGKLTASLVDDSINLNLKYNNVTSNVKEILKDISSRLKVISENIGYVFTDSSYVYDYSATRITYNDSLALRSSILAAAAKLDFICAYNWVDDVDVEPKTAIILNTDVEYLPININPATVLNKGNFFTLSDTSSLLSAKDNFVKALELAVSLPNDYAEDFSKLEVESILDSVSNGSSYIYIIQKEEIINGVITPVDEENYVNLSNLFNSQTALEQDDFGSSFEIDCANEFFDNLFGETSQYNETISIVSNNAQCLNPVLIPNINNITNILAFEAVGKDFDYAKILPTTKPTSENSSLDDVLVKIVYDGQTYEGQALLDYLFN
ncbi:hypothetical protein [Halarcobacter sp.]|uniref:hypothetical protein n=1 Tax=Halarcobacter sp. TaxID=2321133 RepID=UPI002AABD4E8|nr:hypothetical protein [Halarcobacter sp.]